MRTQLVIFDCDGVLVDSEPLANAVFAQHLNALGLHYTAQSAMQQFMGKSLKTCMAEVATQLRDANLTIPAQFPHAFLEAMQADTFKVLAAQVQAVDGARDAIQALRQQDIKVCVASSGDHSKIQLTLGKTQLLSLFNQQIFSASQVSNGKPAPDLFLFAAAQMQVKPEHCLVVEDSPAGLQAAVAANMNAIGYAAATTPDFLLADARVAAAHRQGSVRLIQHMSELNIDGFKHE